MQPSWWHLGDWGSKALNNCNQAALLQLAEELLKMKQERLVSAYSPTAFIGIPNVINTADHLNVIAVTICGQIMSYSL